MALYLIDGNSYVYRAFYAIRGLTDSRGRPTNAVYGFTNMLLKIIRERKPEGLLVSFDTPGPTERHALFEEYKAHRPKAPDDLVVQWPYIKKMVSSFRLPTLEMPGYEADDVIATLAERAAAQGEDVYIVSGDKDMLQLVSKRVKVYDPMKDKEYDEGAVRERFGVPPGRVVELMALMGDPVDNIPGVKGVGEKTARELLSEFESLDDLLAHPERIKKPRLRALIAEGLDNIRLSRRLAEINRQVPLGGFDMDFTIKEPDWQALVALFKEMEFTSFMDLVPSGPAPGMSYEAVLDLARLDEVASSIKGDFAIDTETTGRDPMADTIVGFSLCAEEGRAFYVPLMHSYLGAPAQVDKKKALDAIRPLIEDEGWAKTGHNLKFDMLVLKREGVELKGPLYDTMVASYLLNPSRADHSLEAVGLEHLTRRKKSYKEVAGDRGFDAVEVGPATEYASEDAELAFELKGLLFPLLRDEGLLDLYMDIEMPLIPVLARMEEAGMKVDTEKLSALGSELDRELESIKNRIYFIAGEEFNINSPKQLGRVLFEGLGLKPGKKKKTGYSTDVGVLEELALTHELPGEVLNWRSLSKLKNTYVDVLPRRVNPRTGRLHTSFNQTATATGRLSSSEPNLQNIPVRGEWGRRIREAFVAEEGCLLVSADYSQIELRILAHMSRDPALVEAFRGGVDVHTSTAMEIFGVPREGVTTDMRRAAKTVNFGVIYGMSPFGLSEALGITREEAEGFIARYFDRHQGVRAYAENVVEEARKRGFVATLMGRKRPVPELMSGNAATRLQGERLAVNSPIQGTAADIIKAAMAGVDKGLREEGLRTRLVLQVHDELLMECPVEESEAAAALLKREMEAAGGLEVPVLVDVGTGRNWAEAH